MDFFLRGKNIKKVLVLNVVEISKDFLIFVDLKITETKFTTIPSLFVTSKETFCLQSLFHV